MLANTTFVPRYYYDFINPAASSAGKTLSLLNALSAATWPQLAVNDTWQLIEPYAPLRSFLVVVIPT